MQHSQLSRVVQDLVKALAGLGGYATLSTAGADDGSITATIAHTDADGIEHTVEVRFSMPL